LPGEHYYWWKLDCPVEPCQEAQAIFAGETVVEEDNIGAVSSDLFPGFTRGARLVYLKISELISTEDAPDDQDVFRVVFYE
jgi:hypothetical protein